MNTIDSAFQLTARTLQQQPQRPSRDGPAREVLGTAIRLETVNHTFLTNSRRRASSTYACAELLWYLSGAADASMILAYAPQYSRFCEETGEAHGAYGARMVDDPAFTVAVNAHSSELATGQHRCYTQMAAVIDVLHRQPASRQAVLSLWNAGDLVHAVLGNRRDLPCTLALMFYRRDARVHCSACMRSNDLWLGLPYDVFCFTSIQKLVAWSLGLEAGSYTHFVGSMHAYERNGTAMRESLKATGPCSTRVIHEPPLDKVSDSIGMALHYEQRIRTKRDSLDTVDTLGRVSDALGARTLLADTVRCCAYQWLEDKDLVKASIHSPALRNGVKARLL